MARLGSKHRPVIVRVQTRERAHEAVYQCEQLGLVCIVGVEADKPEDLSDIQRALAQPPQALAGPKIGRNDPCVCGSGKKSKKCCGQRSTAL